MEKITEMKLKNANDSVINLTDVINKSMKEREEKEREIRNDFSGLTEDIDSIYEWVFQRFNPMDLDNPYDYLPYATAVTKELQEVYSYQVKIISKLKASEKLTKAEEIIAHAFMNNCLVTMKWIKTVEDSFK